MAAILDTRRRWRTQFWKGTTQRSFQQSLVEIGSVVSEEKKYFLISSPLFSIMMNLLTYITGFFYELWTFAYFDWLCKLEKRGMKFKKSSPLKKIGKSSKFIKNPVIYVKKLIIMLIQFKFGHFLA
jgi:hypothetical protein